jgi:hypothetical protein
MNENEIPDKAVAKDIVNIEKRIEDVKWMIGYLVTISGIALTVFGTYMSLNLNNEKAEIRQFKEEISELVRGKGGNAELEILRADGRGPLNGSTINVDIEKTPGKDHQFLKLDFILHNKGDGWSGEFTTKIYTVAPIVQNVRSSDEPDFDYENYLNRDDSESIPGGASIRRWSWVMIRRPAEEKIKPGRYPILVKEYYGEGVTRVAEARFTAQVR